MTICIFIVFYEQICETVKIKAGNLRSRIARFYLNSFCIIS